MLLRQEKQLSGLSDKSNQQCLELIALSGISLFFPTCQVRVVRFYVSPIFLPSFLRPFLPSPPRPPRPPPPDLNHDHPRPVFPAGPRPRHTTTNTTTNTQPQTHNHNHNTAHNHSTQPEDPQATSRTTILTTMATCSSLWHQDK